MKRVHLDVQMGEHSIDPTAVKAKDTVKTMEFSLQHLIDQMTYISRQQNYQRVRRKSTKRRVKRVNTYTLTNRLNIGLTLQKCKKTTLRHIYFTETDQIKSMSNLRLFPHIVYMKRSFQTVIYDFLFD